MVVVAWILLPWASASGEDAADKRAQALWARAIAREDAPAPDAIQGLLDLGDAAADVLVEGLGATESWQRSRAARVLEKLGPRGAPAVPALIDALYDRSWIVRRDAAYALAAMGDAGREGLGALREAVAAGPMLEQYPQEGPSEHEAATWSLLRLDASSVDTAREILRRKPTSRILYAYLEKDPDRLLVVLPSLLTSSSWRVREAAIWVLAYLVPTLQEREAWLQGLADASVEDAMPAVRLSATRVLNRLVAHAHIEVSPSLLVPALSSEDPAVRRTAADTLAFLVPDGDGLVEALLLALQDTDPWVRRGAVIALGRTEDPGLRSAVERLLDDADIAPAAAVSLVSLGARDPDALALVATTALEGRASRPKPATLFLYSGRGLRAMGGRVDLGARAEEVLRAIGADAVSAVTPHARAASILVRERAHQMLSQLGPRGHEVLRRMLDGDSSELAREAAAALVAGTVPSDDAVRILLDAAVADDEDVPDAVLSDEVHWRETVIPLLSRAKPTVTHALLEHARARLAGAGNGADASALLEVHEAVLRRRGEGAKAHLEDASDDPVLGAWVRQVLSRPDQREFRARPATR